ncbi:TPA: helix-turn-helix domain-containing protein [Salmonella enterica]|nr:helix-turn-helix domain-containing protein [Salmonella enterica]
MKPITLHERITARRKDLGYTQQKVADMVGKSHVTIYKWEMGDTEPKGKNLFALATALKCSPTWLMFGDEEQTPPPAAEMSNELDERQTRLLDLFNSLPESEKEKIIGELESRVENFNRLFEELLKVRKSHSSPK